MCVNEYTKFEFLAQPPAGDVGRQPHIRGVRAEDRKLNMEDNIKGRKQKDRGSGTELWKTPDLNGQEKEEEVVSRLGENK